MKEVAAVPPRSGTRVLPRGTLDAKTWLAMAAVEEQWGQWRAEAHEKETASEVSTPQHIEVADCCRVRREALCGGQTE
ncbi:hypothetical protein NDU88_007244 [Pleurodeles waltl]|uniref:Uncharacterized protein n=1 Tax=Pleurodeles waltl TaxID=8319 RepID=A0AAV7SRZ2_PLEWA|nr:hypothetical protein NDU88_007244 [Pleurodeles waltl]